MVEQNITAELFRKRARFHRYQAWSILCVVFGLIAGAIYIFFIGASELTKSDVKQPVEFTSVNQILDRITTLESEIGDEPSPELPLESEAKFRATQHRMHILMEEANTAVNLLKQKTRNRLISTGKFGVQEEIGYSEISGLPNIAFPERFNDASLPFDTNQLISVDDNVHFAQIIEENPETVETLTAKHLEMNEVAAKLRNFSINYLELVTQKRKEWRVKNQNKFIELDQLRAGRQLLQNQENEIRFGIRPNPSNVDFNIPPELLIQTNITRFGAMIIIMFFVSILINLYRYLMRLSAYYDARGDIVLITNVSKTSSAKLNTLVTAFSPEGYDFGKSPRSPSDQAIELAKTVVSKVSK